MRTIFNNKYKRNDLAVIARNVVPAVDRNDAHLVGEGIYPVTEFLFWFRAAPLVLYRDKGSVLATADIPAGVKWVIILGQGIGPAPALKPVLSTADISIYRSAGS
jgi:hypothetical protein